MTVADDEDQGGWPVEEWLALLHEVPFERFIRRRKELAGELEAQGEKMLAQRVLEERKPTRAIWALRQVARRAPEILSGFENARAAAEKARSGADLITYTAVFEAYRQRVPAILQAAEGVLAEAGRTAQPAERREICEALDTSFLRQRLIGWPDEPAERGDRVAAAVDMLAAFAAAANSTPDKAPPRAPSQRPAPEIAETEAEVSNLEADLSVATERAREADAKLAATRDELSRAALEAEATERRRDDVDRQLADAKRRLQALQKR